MRNMDGELFFRHKEHGEIFRYDERLKDQPKLELVSRKKAFPHLYAPEGALDRVSKVDISVPEEIANPPAQVAPELAAQLGKTFSPVVLATPKASKAAKPAMAPPSSTGLREEL